LVKNENVGQKMKIWSKNENFDQESKILTKNRKFGQKLKMKQNILSHLLSVEIAISVGNLFPHP